MENFVLKILILLCVVILIGLILFGCNLVEYKVEIVVLIVLLKNSGWFFGVYYFGVGYFMLVFENICYDLDEMKVFGIDIVCIGIIESDIKYNEGNICFIIEEVY